MDKKENILNEAIKEFEQDIKKEKVKVIKKILLEQRNLDKKMEEIKNEINLFDELINEINDGKHDDDILFTRKGLEYNFISNKIRCSRSRCIQK